MKKISLYILGSLIVLILLLFTLITVRKNRTFNAPYPDIKASTDSSIIARGKHLAYGPAHCAACHAPMHEALKVDKGEVVDLSGGFDFFLPIGTIHTPNITSDPETGIGKLADKEIARSLRYGVRHDGKAMLDIMPFYDLSDDDLTAIISFLRTQRPVRNLRPDHEWNLLGQTVRAFIIEPAGDSIVPPSPEPDSTIAYGKYLAASVANCRGCHTLRNLKTGAFTGIEYAGTQQFELVNEKGEIVKGKHIITPNLTPDVETGRIVDWTREDFIKRFRNGRLIPGSPMPWGSFSRMTDVELTAIYKFLQSLDPVKSITPLGIQEGDPQM